MLSRELVAVAVLALGALGVYGLKAVDRPAGCCRACLAQRMPDRALPGVGVLRAKLELSAGGRST